MKILLRSDYKWYEATFNKQNKVFEIDQSVNRGYLEEIQIVSIKDDTRNDFVICNGCGEVIPNTKEAIKKHLELATNSKACFHCKKMKETDVSIAGERKYTLNEDGTYIITEKRNATLCCSNGSWYGGPLIDSEQARERCKYASCASKGVQTWSDIFTKYPGLFDELCTVDALNKKKWKFEAKHGSCIEFKATGSLRLYVRINNLGIIDKFTYAYRNYEYDFVYSKKYNKIFWMSYGKYTEKAPSSNITVSNLAKIIEKVAEIYEGDSTK